MKRAVCFVLLVALQATSWSMYCGHGHGKEIELATDAPGPLSAEESRKLFAVAEGFRVELVAAEPHLADPTAVAFGPRGRLFVCL